MADLEQIEKLNTFKEYLLRYAQAYRQNVLNISPIEFSGLLNDISISGFFNSPLESVDFVVEIDGVATNTNSLNADTYRWSNTGGEVWNEEKVPITAMNMPLSDGVIVNFASQTGHTPLGSKWEFTVYTTKLIELEFLANHDIVKVYISNEEVEIPNDGTVNDLWLREDLDSGQDNPGVIYKSVSVDMQGNPVWTPISEYDSYFYTTVTSLNPTLDIVESNEIESLEVSGLDFIEEEAEHSYIVIVTYADGSTQNAYAVWSIDDINLGFISTNALGHGIFIPQRQTERQTVTIIGRITTPLGYKFAFKEVEIKGVAEAVIAELRIEGVADIEEGNSTLVKAYANFSDGTEKDVSHDVFWSIKSNPSFATINGAGLITTGGVDSDQCFVVKADFIDQDAGISVQAEHVVTLLDDAPPVLIYPRWGTEAANQFSEEFVRNLESTGSSPDRFEEEFTLNTTLSQFMYYAYPVTYGLATFVDLDTGEVGGWDGMVSFPNMGPAILRNVDIFGDGRDVQDWYVYRTDNSNLGTKRWKVI